MVEKHKSEFSPSSYAEPIRYLEASGVDYRIVGSLAVVAWTKKDIPTRDMDVICLSGSLEEIKMLQEELDKKTAFASIFSGQLSITEKQPVLEKINLFHD